MDLSLIPRWERPRTRAGQPIIGKARALWDFDAESELEVGMRRGDVLNVIEKLDFTWWYCENASLAERDPSATKVQGSVPVEYTEDLDFFIG